MLDDRDLTDMRDALAELMPDEAAITRTTDTQTGGDYVEGAPVAVATVKCRLWPMGDQSDPSVDWPASVREAAAHLLTVPHDTDLDTGDTVTVTGKGEYEVVAVRFTDASWETSIRAALRRLE